MSLVVYSQDRDLVPGEGQIVVYNQAYFEYLQAEDGYTGFEDEARRRNSRIPEDIFVQGYYQRFFKQVGVLGNGSRAVVYKVKHMLLENELGTFALKKICIGDDMHWLYRCLKEVKLLNRLTEESSHLITYNHVWLERCPVESLILTQNDGSSVNMDIPTTMPYMFILQQFCRGGNLEDTIQYQVFNRISGNESRLERRKKLLNHKKSRVGLTTRQIVSIANDIATGLKQLHSLRIIHRDLKPSNCLLLEEFDRSDTDKFPKCVIGDFGESQLYGQLRDATGSTGTLEFVAPELTKGAQFSFKSDIYAFGMILYFVIMGQLPFNSKDMSAIKHEINELSFSPEAMSRLHDSLDLVPIDPSLYSLVCEMLNHTPSLRPDSSQIEYQLNIIMKSINKSINQEPEIQPCYFRFATLYALLIALTLTTLNHSHWNWWKYCVLFITGLCFNHGQDAGNLDLLTVLIASTIISIISMYA
ncbi:Iks1 [Kluyveromyces lactis]|nr:Iks1 [Kluyveromyces lactis]